ETGMRYDFGKIKVVDIDTSKLATRNGYIYVKESEETEVKKDIEWLKEETSAVLREVFNNHALDYVKYIEVKRQLERLFAQLDEPEVLSQEFIDKYKVDYDNWMPAVPIVHLQNLLVPKRDEVDRAYKDGYEKGKQHA